MLKYVNISLLFNFSAVLCVFNAWEHKSWFMKLGMLPWVAIDRNTILVPYHSYQNTALT